MTPVTCLSLQHHLASFHKTKYILKCLTTSNMGCLGCPNLSFETAVNVPKPTVNFANIWICLSKPNRIHQKWISCYFYLFYAHANSQHDSLFTSRDITGKKILQFPWPRIQQK